MESRFIPAGSYLFKIGDPDDSIYVVQSGRINVYISDQVWLVGGGGGIACGHVVGILLFSCTSIYC